MLKSTLSYPGPPPPSPHPTKSCNNKVPSGYHMNLGCTWQSGPSSCSTCWGGCCADPAVGQCPTSSCHANELGDQELNCPHSANCPGAPRLSEPAVQNVLHAAATTSIAVLPLCLLSPECAQQHSISNNPLHSARQEGGGVQRYLRDGQARLPHWSDTG